MNAAFSRARISEDQCSLIHSNGARHAKARRLRPDGCSIEVYNVLGYGMAEEIYQQSLEIELGLRNIPYQSKADVKVIYKE